MAKKCIELETAIALLHESEIMGIPVWNAGLARGIEKLEGLPAADVVEVRHGRWMWELADNGWANHICSECGYTKNTDIHVRLGYDYCPNCGAKMDGGQDE